MQDPNTGQRAAAIGFLRRRGTERKEQAKDDHPLLLDNPTSPVELSPPPIGVAPSAESQEQQQQQQQQVSVSQEQDVPEPTTALSPPQQSHLGSPPAPYSRLVTLERISVMLRRKEEELRLQKEAEEMNETTFERKLRLLEEQRQQRQESEGDDGADRLAQRALAIGFLGDSRRRGNSPRLRLERRPTSRAEAAVTHPNSNMNSSVDAGLGEWDASQLRRSKTTLGRRRSRLHQRRGSADSIVPEDVQQRDELVEADFFSEPEADVGAGYMATEGGGSVRSDTAEYFEVLKGDKEKSGRYSPSAFGSSVPMSVDPSMPMPPTFPVRSSSRSRLLASPKMERAVAIPGPLSPTSPLSPLYAPRGVPMLNGPSGLRGQTPLLADDYDDDDDGILWDDEDAMDHSTHRNLTNDSEPYTSSSQTGIVSPHLSPRTKYSRQRSESELPIYETALIGEVLQTPYYVVPEPSYPALHLEPISERRPSLSTNRHRGIEIEEPPPDDRHQQFPTPTSPLPPIPVPQTRKFLHQGRAWQVITTSTVKDRYLFLFTDVLVIAKQIKTHPTDPLKTTYQIKSVMALRNAQLVLKDERWAYTSRLPSPAVQAATKKFATNPIKAVAYLIAKRAFPCTPDAISHFLHVTPGLNRKQLGRFLGVGEHYDILQAFLSSFDFKSIPLTDSLRLFLSQLRLPGEASIIDSILESFSKRWYHCNKDSISFSASVTLKLVFAIMELNADLHNPYSGDESVVTVREFVDRFRSGVRMEAVRLGEGAVDPVGVEFLEGVYESLKREKLDMADGDEGGKIGVWVGIEDTEFGGRNTIQQQLQYQITEEEEDNPTILPPFPSRLTLKHTSPSITIRIPSPDPTLRIHLYGSDLEFSPSVLTFAQSPTSTFRIRGTGLGRKLIYFSKRGPTSKRYKTIQTRQITIEPAFLRWSFQLGFVNDGFEFPVSSSSPIREREREREREMTKKKYLFAVSDSGTRQAWVSAFSATGLVPNAPISRRLTSSSSHHHHHHNSNSRNRTNSSSSSTSSSSEETELQNSVAIRVLKDYVLPVEGVVSGKEVVEGVLRNGRVGFAVGFLRGIGGAGM